MKAHYNFTNTDTIIGILLNSTIAVMSRENPKTKDKYAAIGFPTVWYVRPATPQTSLRIRADWSEPLLVA